MQTKILCVCGSSRRDSLNQKLLEIAALGATQEGGAATHIRLRDFQLPIYDGDMETASVQMLRSPNAEALPLVHGVPRLAVPVARVDKCIAIGLDYSNHAKEADLPIPTEPVVFSKATSSLVGPNDPVTLPKDGRKGDWDRAVGSDIGRGGGSPKPLDMA